MTNARSTPWAVHVDDVCAALVTDPDRGLSTEEATARLARDGPNELVAQPPEPRWRRLARQLTDPLVLLLLAAIVISTVVWWSEGASGRPVEAIVIAAIVVLNAGIGYWQESKAIAAVDALRELSATRTAVVRDGELTRVPTTDVVVGDLVALASGDAVGADCRLVDEESLDVAEAALTGESTPVAKQARPIEANRPLAERDNMVFSGTAIVSGRATGVVVATGMATELGQIATLIETQPEEPTPLQNQIAWLGRQLGRVVVVLAAIVVLAVVVTTEERSADSVVDALLVGVSLAVAAVPEGLPAILSVVLALGVQRMARERAIVKRLSSVETLGSASAICTDKTGTLTRGEMTIVRVVTGGRAVEIGGVGYVPEGDATLDGAAVDDPVLLADVAAVLTAGSLANDADLAEEAPGRWAIHGDPTEAAFLVAEAKLGTAAARRRYERIAELPFTSERRRMTTLHLDLGDLGDRVAPGEARDAPPEPGGPLAAPSGRRADGPRYVLVGKGAPDALLERCSHELRDGHVVPLTTDRRAEIAAEVERLASDALRAIAVAGRRVTPAESGTGGWVGALTDRHHARDADAPDAAELIERAEHDLVHLGLVGMLDPPRPEAATAIHEAQRAGIRIVMITGDHPLTASRIGESLGIAGMDGGITGAELAALDEAEFDDAVHRTSVFARVEPRQKLRIVEVLQARDGIVAMTGDGVNDAPALRRADIGVAMGITGTEVSKEAADMILADDNFATILRAVREGREILADIRKVVRYLLASNSGEVLVMLLGVLGAGLLGLHAVDGEAAVPLLATQILWINLLTDGAMALALGVDPAVEDVMERPPRRITDRIVDRDMLVTIALIGTTAALAALVAFDLRLPGGPLGGDGDITTARTMAFTTLVLAQIGNAFNARSDRVSAFVRPFDNLALWISIAVTVALQVAVVHVAWLQTAFATAPLDLTEWLIVIGLASSVLLVEELRKLSVRRRDSVANLR